MANEFIWRSGIVTEMSSRVGDKMRHEMSATLGRFAFNLPERKEGPTYYASIASEFEWTQTVSSTNLVAAPCTVCWKHFIRVHYTSQWYSGFSLRSSICSCQVSISRQNPLLYTTLFNEAPRLSSSLSSSGIFLCNSFGP